MTSRRWRLLALVMAAVLALISVNAVYRWRHDRANRAPFGPDVLAASATVEPADNTTMQSKLAQLGVPYTPPLFANPGGQLVVGKVSWRQPPRWFGGGVFFILLIDKGSHLKPPRMTAGGSPPTEVAVGDDGVLSDVEARYPWLRGAGLLGPDGQTYLSG